MSFLKFNADSQQLQCVYENLRKRPSLISWKNVLLLHVYGRPHSARIIQKKWSLRAGLFYPIQHILFLCTQWFPFFSVFTKCSWLQNIFSEKIRWKGLLKICWTRKRVNFSREESTLCLRNAKRWLKIVNIRLIGINPMLKCSWINYILQKQKLYLTPLKSLCINITFIFHSFFIFLAKSRYIFIFSFSFTFPLRFVGIENLLYDNFFLLIDTRNSFMNTYTLRKDWLQIKITLQPINRCIAWCTDKWVNLTVKSILTFWPRDWKKSQLCKWIHPGSFSH